MGVGSVTFKKSAESGRVEAAAAEDSSEWLIVMVEMFVP